MECSIQDCVWYVELFFVIGILATGIGVGVAGVAIGMWIKDVGDAIISHHKEDDEPEAPDENATS